MAKEQYTATAALEWATEQGKQAIEYEMKKIEEAMKGLQGMIENNQWHGYDASLWTEGHLAENIAKMASLIGRQQMMQEAIRMVKREQAERE